MSLTAIAYSFDQTLICDDDDVMVASVDECLESVAALGIDDEDDDEYSESDEDVDEGMVNFMKRCEPQDVPYCQKIMSYTDMLKYFICKFDYITINFNPEYKRFLLHWDKNPTLWLSTRSLKALMLFAENNYETHDKMEIQQNGEMVQQKGEMVRFVKLYNNYILHFTNGEDVVTTVLMTSYIVNSLRDNCEYIFNKALEYINAFKLHVVEPDLGIYE